MDHRLSEETEIAILDYRSMRGGGAVAVSGPTSISPLVEVANDRDVLLAENEALRTRVTELEAKNVVLTGLITDPEVGGSCFEAQDPDADPGICGGSWSCNGEYLGDTCWEHQKRAIFGVPEKAAV